MFDDQRIHGAGAGARRRARVERDTPLVPRAVAEAVGEEASTRLGEPLPRRWIAQLTARANTVYGGNERFRRLLRRQGNAGRDWLWAFTRHWLAALIWKHRRALHARLPANYKVGHPLPQVYDRRTRQSAPENVRPRRGPRTGRRGHSGPRLCGRARVRD